MASRRMMSKEIIDTDLFLDMGVGSQNLYFHFLLRADDDGFVSSPKKLMRMLGISEDDFKVLIAKKFVIPFESGVCVIRHWKIHNYIQTDRYKKTQYSEEMALLKQDKSNVYKMDTECIQNVSKVDTQVRLGKVRLGKVRKEKINTPQTKVCETFILSDYLNSFDASDRVAMIIRWYFRKKGLDFPTKKAVQKEYARWIRDAKVLADYPEKKIIETQERVEAKFPLDWKLSTIVKYISETPTNQEILESFKKQAIAEVGLDRDWEARVRDKLNELWGLEYSTCRQDPRFAELIEKNPWLK